MPCGGHGRVRFWWLALATASRAATRKWMQPFTVRGGGVLQRASVLPLNATRHWGPCNGDWLDNAWLCMRNHAGRGTHTGAEGREEEGEGDDDRKSHSLGRPGRPRKVP